MESPEHDDDRLRTMALVLAEAEHRVKTSITIISAWASTLDDRWDALTLEERRTGIHVIRERSDALKREATRLLAGAESAKPELEPQSVDLVGVLRAPVRAIAGVSPDHVVYLVEEGAARAWADPGALQQVVTHLVDNAIKYSPRGGTVTVRVRGEPDMVELAVSDEGVGIPVGEDVFAPFWRGDTSRPPHESIGVGLFVVRNLVQAMGGTVSARRNDGGGSTFTVRLPGGTEAHPGGGSGTEKRRP